MEWCSSVRVERRETEVVREIQWPFRGEFFYAAAVWGWCGGYKKACRVHFIGEADLCLLRGVFVADSLGYTSIPRLSDALPPSQNTHRRFSEGSEMNAAVSPAASVREDKADRRGTGGIRAVVVVLSIVVNMVCV